MKPLFYLMLICLTESGCILGSPCVEHPLEVILMADVVSGPAPLTVSFEAYGDGFYCGCCGGKDPTSVVNYEWDLDDDGGIDLAGPDQTTCGVTFTEPGSYVMRVTVTDDAGDTASDRLVLEVHEPHEP